MDDQPKPELSPKEISELIRKYAQAVVAQLPDNPSFPQSNLQTAVLMLQLAWCDAIRDNWANIVTNNKQLRKAAPVVAELMKQDRYEQDVICAPPGLQLQVATIDGKQATCLEFAMTNALPLSAIYTNKVLEVLDVMDKLNPAKPTE